MDNFNHETDSRLQSLRSIPLLINDDELDRVLWTQLCISLLHKAGIESGL